MHMQQYQPGDLVWALDHSRYYEARIVNTTKTNGQWHYFVHFQGWNRKWDRWVEQQTLRSHETGQEVLSAMETCSGGKRKKTPLKGIPAADLAEGVAEELRAAMLEVKDEGKATKKRRQTLAVLDMVRVCGRINAYKRTFGSAKMSRLHRTSGSTYPLC
jgi:hypothetical protein